MSLYYRLRGFTEYEFVLQSTSSYCRVRVCTTEYEFVLQSTSLYYRVSGVHYRLRSEFSENNGDSKTIAPRQTSLLQLSSFWLVAHRCISSPREYYFVLHNELGERLIKRVWGKEWRAGAGSQVPKVNLFLKIGLPEAAGRAEHQGFVPKMGQNGSK